MYQAGSKYNFASSEDYVTYRYDLDGNMLWTKTYNAPSSGLDRPNTLAVDSNKNVYVSGWTTLPDNTPPVLTIKYAPDGSQLWLKTFQEGDGTVGTDMAIDDSGNAYVYAYNNKGGGDYLVLLKYASDGNLLWQKKSSNRSVSLNRSVLKIDAGGNVHLALLGQDDAGKNDLLVVKYDPNGNVVSERRWNPTSRPQSRLDARFLARATRPMRRQVGRQERSLRDYKPHDLWLTKPQEGFMAGLCRVNWQEQPSRTVVAKHSLDA